MNMLESIDIKKYGKKFDTISVGCDYLRLSYCGESEFIEDRLYLLDTDNSNFGTVDINGIQFTYQKIPCTLGMGLYFTCSYNEVVVPCFEFVKFNENTKFITNRYGKLDFYGSFFRLGDVGFFDLDLMLSMVCFFISGENPRITRYDYRIDFFNRLQEIDITPSKDILKIHSQSKLDNRYTGDNLTNRFVGTKDSGTYSIRLYNKLIDTDIKDKIFIYQDYFNYKTVQRLEFEFQRNFLKGFTLEDYLDKTVQKKIESILKINDKFWSGAICYQYDSSTEITDKNKSRYIRRFNNMALKFAKNKINPLIQSYEILYENLEREELESIVNDFLKLYIGNAKKDLYDKMIV